MIERRHPRQCLTVHRPAPSILAAQPDAHRINRRSSDRENSRSKL